MKLALIVDKSEAYVHFCRDLLLRQWGEPQVEKIFDLSEAGRTTLFGDSPVGILELEDISAIKLFVKRLEVLSNEREGVQKAIGSGLVVSTQVSRKSTKKAEQAVLAVAGEVFVSSGKNLTADIVSHINLNTAARKFIIEYLGEDYESAIPIVKSLIDFPAEVQRKISVEDLYIRLPKPPGSIPPWDLEKPLWRGDVSETLRTFRRIVKNTPLLVVLTIIRNQIQNAFRAGAIGESQDNVAKVLEIKNGYPVKLAVERSHKLSLSQLQKAVSLLDETEAKIKGAASTDPQKNMEIMLIRLATILRGTYGH